MREPTCFREAQWGTACERCDADPTCAWASVVWRAGAVFPWIAVTAERHIRKKNEIKQTAWVIVYCCGTAGPRDQGDFSLTADMNRAKNTYLLSGHVLMTYVSTAWSRLRSKTGSRSSDCRDCCLDSVHSTRERHVSKCTTTSSPVFSTVKSWWIAATTDRRKRTSMIFF